MMAPIDLMKILDLLERLNNNEIKILFIKDELSIKFPKGKKIDSCLLSEIEAYKDKLIKYFTFLKEGLVPSNKPDLFSGRVKDNGEYYYPITPVQIYWVNDNWDKEYKQSNILHGSVFITYEVLGNFDPSVFKIAVLYLIKRHESLRSTFHYVNGKYLMKIESEHQLNNFEFRDTRIATVDPYEVQKFIEFDCHKFDFEKGPLFMVRLIQTENARFIISIKVHHVIFDTMSRDILARDLLDAYKAISKKSNLQLPALKYQYKEYLSFINQFNEQNYQRSKKYWNDLYSCLPNKLIIPNVKKSRSNMLEKICKYEESSFSEELMSKAKIIAKEFSVTLFVLLQAAVKKFLYHITGQNDIAVGTYVFGRDFSDCENQIGCYAKTVLIRTVLARTDSFSDVVKKVSKSNEAMQEYKAYPLINVLEDMLPPGQQLFGSYWKINIQYADRSYHALNEDNSNIADGLNLKFIRQNVLDNFLTAVDLQFRFLHFDKKMILKLEYDSSLYESLTIKELMCQFLTYTDELLSDISSTPLREKVRIKD
jgi:NRPS condensation-like uncharacterized protein